MNRTAASLSIFLAAAGISHFARPAFFEQVVPPQLPGGRAAWIAGSGVAELAVAAAIAVPRTRQAGCLAAAALFVGVFPGNVYMAARALRSPRASSAKKAATVARLPLQAPLVLWALRASRQR
ncbi:hypothetical protein [Kineosporia sp. NBRC 101731]|uniref:DoxX family protein n=1 Tax=Kineosporia sp. NBRC 101731 TaxID=3032199 RepID=UPI0024A4C6CC|nr:hypothetical protein [Kineosporia sp. NBRC 101731]GLY31474.1 membrane protein [Kineosporia sp. NBRC 101731]